MLLTKEHKMTFNLLLIKRGKINKNVLQFDYTFDMN